MKLFDYERVNGQKWNYRVKLMRTIWTRYDLCSTSNLDGNKIKCNHL